MTLIQLIAALNFSALSFGAPGVLADLKTPWQMVDLLNEEMRQEANGLKAMPCAAGTSCKKVRQGNCDLAAYFGFLLPSGEKSPEIFKLPPLVNEQTAGGSPIAKLSMEFPGAEGGYVKHLEAGYQLPPVISVKAVCVSSREECPTRLLFFSKLSGVALEVMGKNQRYELLAQGSVLKGGVAEISLPVSALQALSSRKEIFKLQVSGDCFANEIPERVLELRATPDSAGKVIGKLHVILSVVPTFKLVAGEKEIPFTPDFTESPDQILGKHTILEQKGEWFRLPSDPLEASAWIHLPGHEVQKFGSGSYLLRQPIKAKDKLGVAQKIPLNSFIEIVSLGKEVEFHLAQDREHSAKHFSPLLKAPLNQFYNAKAHLMLAPASD